jgi:predicted AlkP superfamily pyrophosphatase or phosphodiesterase
VTTTAFPSTQSTNNQAPLNSCQFSQIKQGKEEALYNNFLQMRLSIKPSLGIVFLILTCLQVFGLYIFLKGFLLTRQTIDMKGQTYASWERFPLHQSEPIQPPPSTVEARKPFKRTIIILIDALRFDFVLNMSNPSDPYFLNQFPVIHHLHHTQPQSSLLFQFRADPPTTTMQRIKGLMTGSLPTFIDAGANFASSAVGEDHLLQHIKNHYEKIYFMGDDTWVNLFPESFKPERTFESDSFKMLDLDSVDNIIVSHLWPLMEGKDEWEVAIAHFLGVDHCGHTYGPSDPNMARKLNQMNGIIERLLPKVDNETLLVVMGDHGMSVEGDHGGESIEELMSGLFLYSGRPLTLNQKDEYYAQLYKRIHQARSTRLAYDMNSISERLSYDATQHPIVAQIHLVPTLAYLLKVPIPFGNLGAIIPDVLYPNDDDNNKIRNLMHMVEQFRINSLQVYDYLTQYAHQTHQLDFSAEKLGPITQHLYAAEKIMSGLVQQPDFKAALDINSFSPSQEDFVELLEEAILEYDAFLISTIKYCEAIWAQFDTGCMFVGIILLGFSTLASFWLMKREPQTTVKRVILAFVSGLSVACAIYFLAIDSLLAKGWFDKMQDMDWVGIGAAFSTCCVAFAMKQTSNVSKNHVFWHNWDWYLILIAATAQSFTLGSNSFVIWEDSGTRFVLGTLTMAWIARNLKCLTSYSIKSTTLAILYPLLFLTMIRISSLTGQCREEQFPHCDYIHSGLLEFGLNNTGYLTMAFIGVAFTIVVCFFGALSKLNGIFIAGLYGISAVIVIYRIVNDIAQKMYVPTTERTEIALLVQKTLNVYMPRLVYGFCLLGSTLVGVQWFFSRYPKRTSRMSWTILLLWSTVLAIVQRPFAAVIVLGSPCIIDILTQGAPSSLLIRLTMLHFLGHHLFFVTGHQVSFASLPWKAAFVGFDEMNYYGGMILVTLSTLTGYIITWLGWFIVLTEATDQYAKDSAVDKADIRQSLHLLTMLQSIPTFLCAIFILILRRHLMTWKIFAPRFLFQILLEVGSHLAAIILEKFV